jgi:hypothetical protein
MVQLVRQMLGQTPRHPTQCPNSSALHAFALAPRSRLCRRRAELPTKTCLVAVLKEISAVAEQLAAQPTSGNMSAAIARVKELGRCASNKPARAPASAPRSDISCARAGIAAYSVSRRPTGPLSA